VQVRAPRRVRQHRRLARGRFRVHRARRRTSTAGRVRQRGRRVSTSPPGSRT
jgi:hypothetical protein